MVAQYKFATLNTANEGLPMEFSRGKELFGLAISNLFCGLMGATPCTGVLVRTGVNIEYGATSRASQLINGFYVLLVTVFAIRAFAFLPMAVIAALLLNSSYSLGKSSIMVMIDYCKKGKWLDAGTIIVVCLICVLLDGAVGLIIGLVFRMAI